jgi:hypothetical protein
VEKCEEVGEIRLGRTKLTYRFQVREKGVTGCVGDDWREERERERERERDAG